MKRQLTGWQRLFVVASGAWFVYIVVQSYYEWPALDDGMTPFRERADRESPTMQAWVAAKRADTNICGPIIPGYSATWEGPWCDYQSRPTLPELEAARYRATMKEGEAGRPAALAKSMALQLLYRFLLWLGPVVGVYFGAWCAVRVCRWVLDGFRRQP